MDPLKTIENAIAEHFTGAFLKWLAKNDTHLNDLCRDYHDGFLDEGEIEEYIMGELVEWKNSSAFPIVLDHIEDKLTRDLCDQLVMDKIKDVYTNVISEIIFVNKPTKPEDNKSSGVYDEDEYISVKRDKHGYPEIFVKEDGRKLLHHIDKWAVINECIHEHTPDVLDCKLTKWEPEMKPKLTIFWFKTKWYCVSSIALQTKTPVLAEMLAKIIGLAGVEITDPRTFRDALFNKFLYKTVRYFFHLDVSSLCAVGDNNDIYDSPKSLKDLEAIFDKLEIDV